MTKATLAETHVRDGHRLYDYVRVPSWYCEQCAVEVHERRCPHCGKLEKEKR